jgi:hypothetical protein
MKSKYKIHYRIKGYSHDVTFSSEGRTQGKFGRWPALGIHTSNGVWKLRSQTGTVPPGFSNTGWQAISVSKDDNPRPPN